MASRNTRVRLPEEAEWIELPVGKRIQDHPLWTTTWNMTGEAASQPILTMEELVDPTEEMIAQFAQARGVLAQNDIRMELWTDVTPAADGETRYVQVEFFGKTTGQFNMEMFLTKGATSRGELGIDADGATYFIKGPLMNTEGDKEAMNTFVETILEYSRKPDSAYIWPGRGGANATASDVLRNVYSGIHVVASAPIGMDDGREGGHAVVDLDTRVYGTDNLFVVDASINPGVPTGNTMAITMLVAEKAAEKILAFDSAKDN